MLIKLENFTGHSNKSGKDFECIKLTIGDYSTLLFPKSDMERNYLQNIIDKGGVFDVEDM